MYPYRTGRGGTVELNQSDLMRAVADSGARLPDYLGRAECHAHAVSATEWTRRLREAGVIGPRGVARESVPQQLGAWLVAVVTRLQGGLAASSSGASAPTVIVGAEADPA